MGAGLRAGLRRVALVALELNPAHLVTRVELVVDLVEVEPVVAALHTRAVHVLGEGNGAQTSGLALLVEVSGFLPLIPTHADQTHD